MTELSERMQPAAARPTAARPDAAHPVAVAGLAQDATRVRMWVRGALDDDGAEMLAAAVEAHVAAGRRYVRVDLHDLEAMTGGAVAALAELHRQVLEQRGTIIFTGVLERVARLLAQRAPELLWLSATAEERSDPPPAGQ